MAVQAGTKIQLDSAAPFEPWLPYTQGIPGCRGHRASHGGSAPKPPEFNVFDTTSAENSQGIPPGCRCSVPLGGARVASQCGLLLRIASDDGDFTLNDKAPFRALCRGKSGTQSSRSALLKASASVAFLKEGALALAVSMSPRSASISSCLTERPMRRSVGSSFTIFITRSWPA